MNSSLQGTLNIGYKEKYTEETLNIKFLGLQLSKLEESLIK